jgi:hypothetical protein
MLTITKTIADLIPGDVFEADHAVFVQAEPGKKQTV